MNAIRVGLIVTLFWALLPENTHAQSPRVVVELAFVSRASEQKPKVSLQEELDAKLESSEATDEGLLPFFDKWLKGKDRRLHEIDTMQLKIPLGVEVEFTTRHSLPAEFEHPDQIVPGMSGLNPAGLKAIVRVDRKPSGKFFVDFRYEKKSLRSPTVNVNEENSLPPSIQTLWLNSSVELEPGHAWTVGPMTQRKMVAGKPLDCEVLLVVGVHYAEPSPFPVK